jgi:hypothetical protein
MKSRPYNAAHINHLEQLEFAGCIDCILKMRHIKDKPVKSFDWVLKRAASTK